MGPVLRAVLEGQMPSGKGQIRTQILGGRLHRFPQKRFTDWRGAAWAQLDRQRGAWPTLRTPALVTVRYFKGDLLRRDTPGIMDALCHLLEWCPVHGKKKAPRCPFPFVADDSLLEAWSWGRPILDRENPRLELTIKPYDDKLAG